MVGVPWCRCESREVQVLEVRWPGETFCPVESLWGVSQLGRCPRGSYETGMLLRGRF